MSRCSERIRFLQHETDLTGEQIAEALGVTPVALSKWKTGMVQATSRHLEAIDRLIGYVSKMKVSRQTKRVFAMNYLRGAARG